MTHPKPDNAPPRNCLIHGSAWCTCNPNTSAPSPNDKYVASLPDWVKGSPVNRREPDVPLACFICGKQKGQPPERCNGHYDNAPTPTGPVLSASPAHIQRLWDLCRLQRHNLFDDEAISPEEFCALVEDHPAVERLETNDGLRDLLAQRDKRVEALEKDRERLDWLSDWNETGRISSPTYSNTWTIRNVYQQLLGEGRDLRAAIDAAMKEPA